MSERLLSGHSRLDGVLGGGLPVDAINMLIGLPGTGKTILAQQYLFANATLERPALYLATVSEPFEKSSATGRASASSTRKRSAAPSSTRTSARLSTSAASPASSSR